MTILLDHKMVKLLETISPYYNIPTTAAPYDIGKFLSLQPPATATLIEYLADREEHGEDKIVGKLKFI